MEFCGREPMDILGWGDCSNNYRSFGRESLRSALRGDGRDPPKLANCRVPISNSESTAAYAKNGRKTHVQLGPGSTGIFLVTVGVLVQLEDPVSWQSIDRPLPPSKLRALPRLFALHI